MCLSSCDVSLLTYPSGRAVYGVDLQSLDCGVSEFEHRSWFVYWSVVFVVCSVGSGPLGRDDRSFRGVLPAVCLIVCDLESSITRWPRPDKG
jgi:hypothetical protein